MKNFWWIVVMLTAKVTDHGDSDALAIVSWRVGADEVPAASLVDVAVLADHEIVADVDPVPVVDVKILVGSNDFGATGLIVAIVKYTTVMYDDVRSRRVRQRYVLSRCVSRFPFVSAHDLRAIWIHFLL